MPNLRVLSEEFLAEVRSMPQRNLAVELHRKLLADEIKVRAKRNLVQARSFAELLDNAIKEDQNLAIEAAQVPEVLITMAKDLKAAERSGAALIWGSVTTKWPSTMPWRQTTAR